MTRDSNNTAATIGFEDQLLRVADALRSNMDAAECKHVVLPVNALRRVDA
jgi:type I restriction enzyme M protein